jgi:hypothetical protein
MLFSWHSVQYNSSITIQTKINKTVVLSSQSASIIHPTALHSKNNKKFNYSNQYLFKLLLLGGNF